MKSNEEGSQECEENASSVAFLSTPSVYYGLASRALKEASVLLDADEEAFGGARSFRRFDFRRGRAGLPQDAQGACDLAVIDPPFVTRECWELYSEAALACLSPDSPGKILATTVRENEGTLRELLGAEPVRFRPAIPSLVYQYELFANYHSPRLACPNPELEPL